MKVFLALAVAAAMAIPAFASEKKAEGKEIVLTGEVVDSVCYLAHGASGPTHHQCATDCAHKGIPLAIANEADGKLYFPTDGNKQLMELISERVTVKGATKHVPDAMELKMPAMGGHNSIDLKVDGGYDVVTIASVEKAPAKTDGPAGK